jgi:hypothetical protein
MAFKVKDLTITVLAGKGGSGGAQCELTCIPPSCDADSGGGCDLESVFCDACTDLHGSRDPRRRRQLTR